MKKYQLCTILLVLLAVFSVAVAEEIPFFDNVNQAVQYVREQVKARNQFVEIKVSFNVYQELDEDMDDIFAHTGDPYEGDFLSCSCGGKHVYPHMNTDYVTLDYTFGYYDDSEEAALAVQAVRDIAAELNLTDPSLNDLNKIASIFDWVVRNVEYDGENVHNDNHPEKWTVYGAAVDRKAVCQGISGLVYSLAMIADVDCRTVESDNMNHMWNIVKYGGLYYQLDATWAEKGDFNTYFMCGSSDFLHMNTDDNFHDREFAERYPLAAKKLNPITQDDTVIVLGGSDIGERRTMSGKTVNLTTDGRPKIIIFFTYDCGVIPGVLSDMQEIDFDGVDVYLLEYDAEKDERLEEAKKRILKELPQVNGAEYILTDIERGLEGSNYELMRIMERETGIVGPFVASPTFFAVNSSNQIVAAVHGYSGGMFESMIDLLRYGTATHYAPHDGDHTWQESVIIVPTETAMGKIARICTKCGKTEYKNTDPTSGILTGQCGDNVFWTFDAKDGSLKITGSGEMWGNYYSPSSIGWLYDEDTELSSYAKTPLYISRVRSVSIDPSITRIGGNMFINFSGVKEITVPEGVLHIGDGYSVFQLMDALEYIEFPSTADLPSAGVELAYCPNLKKIVFHGDAHMLWTGGFDERDRHIEIIYPHDNETWTQEIIQKYRNSGYNIHSDSEESCRHQLKTDMWGFEPSANGEMGYVYSGRCLLCNMYLFNGINISPSDVLRIPPMVSEIESEAFAGIASLQINLPESVQTIGSRAFADYRGARLVLIPDTVQNIADDAFENAQNTILAVNEGSYAHQYALRTGILFCTYP